MKIILFKSRKKLISLLVISAMLVSNVLLIGQNNSFEPNFKDHIQFLSSDSLEGRLTGTKGEKIALQYLVDQFSTIGLAPRGSDGYLQPFEFTFRREVKAAALSIDGKPYSFYPLSESGNASIQGDIYFAGFGIKAPSLKHNDYEAVAAREGKIFLIDLSSPDGVHPHSKYIEHSDIKTKITTAMEEGAAGILFFNNDPNLEDPPSALLPKGWIADIPVGFIEVDDLSGKELMGLFCQLTINIEKDKRTGHNVLGYIDNGAATTVVIGAHYDHLGYGDVGSLYAGTTKEIHNGADDNASGTAMVIELAEKLISISLRGNNYLFIAFSGEELGLYGSGFFVDNATLDMNSINYMINMDMVGRLNEDDQNLSVNGVGTSPVWLSVLSQSYDSTEISVVTTESGVGPSDHTPFYLQDIPVLHFFTGLHDDYHMPGDDEEKINYSGMVLVYDLIYELIRHLDESEKLAFTKTKDAGTRKAPKLKVTLGIIPDYMFEGNGLRLSGIKDGRPAAVAGLTKGDIIIKIGDVEIQSMYDYMEALSPYSKGDETTVTVVRQGDQKTFNLLFN